VTELANPQLGAWESFYVIVGSSGAALIGLQFVVITLIAERHNFASFETVNAFGTPTVVHLAFALLVSAIMSAPWHTLAPASFTLVACGFAGLAYGAVVIRRAARQTDYKPVWEDWLWYVFSPCVLYATLTVSALFLRTRTQSTLYVIGAVALGLLLLGIRNAWDTVTHIVLTSEHQNPAKQD